MDEHPLAIHPEMQGEPPARRADAPVHPGARRPRRLLARLEAAAVANARRRPLTSVAVAAGAGFVLGRVLLAVARRMRV